MFIGTQYYRPPHPPASDWERDFANMVSSGISLIKLWIYWSRVNPRPEQWVWDDLDTIFDLAAKHGINILAQLMPDNMPYWFKDQHPEALFRDKTGNIVPVSAGGAMAAGGIPGPNYDHPVGQQFGGEFIRRTVEHFRGHAALYAWDIWNELWPFVIAERTVLHNDATVTKWRAWLKRQYGAIEALNEHWLRSYASFDEVEWPISGIYADLGTRYRFDQERVADWMNWRIDLVRGLDSAHKVCAHTGSIGPVAALNDPWGGDLTDPWLFTKGLDVWGTSVYFENFYEWSFMLDSNHSAAQDREFWVFEMNGGRGNYKHPGQPGPGFYSNYLRSGEEIRSQILLSFSHRATGAIFWQWRPEIFGPESPGWGLATASGELTERTEALRGIAAILRSHHALFDKMTFEPSQVAILWDPRSYHAERLASWKPGFGWLGGFELFGYHKALANLGLSVDYLNAHVVVKDGIPDHVKILFHPYPVVDRNGLYERLSAWVDRGGTLVVGPGVGLFTDRLDGSHHLPPLRWRELLGVSQQEIYYPAEPHLDLLTGPTRQIPGYHLIESYRLVGAQPLGVWGSHYALTENRFGKGRTISVGTFLGQPLSVQQNEGMMPWMASLCADAGVTHPLRVIGNQVISRVAVSGDSHVLFIHNTNNAPAIAWITAQDVSAARVTNLLTDESVGMLTPGTPLSVSLKPLDSAVYAVQPNA